MIKCQSLFQNAAISPILISIVFLKKFLCLKLTFSIKTNGTVVCFCNESRNGKNLKNVMYHSSSNSFFLFFGLMAIPKISAVWKLCSFTTIIPHSCWCSSQPKNMYIQVMAIGLRLCFKCSPGRTVHTAWKNIYSIPASKIYFSSRQSFSGVSFVKGKHSSAELFIFQKNILLKLELQSQQESWSKFEERKVFFVQNSLYQMGFFWLWVVFPVAVEA